MASQKLLLARAHALQDKQVACEEGDRVFVDHGDVAACVVVEAVDVSYLEPYLGRFSGVFDERRFARLVEARFCPSYLDNLCVRVFGETEAGDGGIVFQRFCGPLIE